MDKFIKGLEYVYGKLFEKNKDDDGNYYLYENGQRETIEDRVKKTTHYKEVVFEKDKDYTYYEIDSNIVDMYNDLKMHCQKSEWAFNKDHIAYVYLLDNKIPTKSRYDYEKLKEAFFPENDNQIPDCLFAEFAIIFNTFHLYRTIMGSSTSKTPFNLSLKQRNFSSVFTLDSKYNETHVLQNYSLTQNKQKFKPKVYYKKFKKLYDFVLECVSKIYSSEDAEEIFNFLIENNISVSDKFSTENNILKDNIFLFDGFIHEGKTTILDHLDYKPVEFDIFFRKKSIRNEYLSQLFIHSISAFAIICHSLKQAEQSTVYYNRGPFSHFFFSLKEIGEHDRQIKSDLYLPPWIDDQFITKISNLWYNQVDDIPIDDYNLNIATIFMNKSPYKPFIEKDFKWNEETRLREKEFFPKDNYQLYSNAFDIALDHYLKKVITEDSTLFIIKHYLTNNEEYSSLIKKENIQVSNKENEEEEEEDDTTVETVVTKKDIEKRKAECPDPCLGHKHLKTYNDGSKLYYKE